MWLVADASRGRGLSGRSRGAGPGPRTDARTGVETGAGGAGAGRPPRLLDRVRQACRVRHHSVRTERAYVYWGRRFVLDRGTRHPDEMGAREVGEFLSQLATMHRVAASTQNQALAALVFLYRVVLERPELELAGLVRARRPVRVAGHPRASSRAMIRSIC